MAATVDAWRMNLGCFAAAVCLTVLPAGEALPADGAMAWQTGVGLKRQLESRLDVHWSGVPLRTALQSVSRSQQVAILLDRRVDPEQKVELEFHEASLEEVLRELVKAQGLGLSLTGSLAYIGPAEYAANLRTLLELRTQETRNLPVTAARDFARPERLRWPDFASPRDLLAQQARSGGVELAGLQQVPHDLWAASDLPSLTLTERLTLIAGQYDLTFRVESGGRRVALIPIPARVAVERGYPGGRLPDVQAKRWAELVPDCRVRVVGERLLVEGRVEDHERLAREGRDRPSSGSGRTASPSSPKRPRAKGELRYTLNVAKGPWRPVAEQLAGKLNLKLNVDEDSLRHAGISQYDEVTLRVEEATVDELLHALLDPVGCEYRLQGGTLEIMAARKAAKD